MIHDWMKTFRKSYGSPDWRKVRGRIAGALNRAFQGKPRQYPSK